MAIVVKANKNDSTHDLIRKFQKIAAKDGIVDRAKDRKYHKKPSQLRAIKKSYKRRLRKRARSLKKMKNVSEEAVKRIYEKINE